MAMSARTKVALILLGALVASPARAAFVDWWLTGDQQARLAYQAGDYSRAARLFSDPEWKALALYASGDFAGAAAWFATVETARGYFYLGNALAHQGQLPQAVNAYRRALELQPDFAEAEFNLKWVGGLAALDEQSYEDAGGTGGKLGADGFVFDDRANDAKQTMTEQEAMGQGLTDAQIEEIWMRRVQTTPAEFLAQKFAYQLQRSNSQPADTATAPGDP